MSKLPPCCSSRGISGSRGTKEIRTGDGACDEYEFQELVVVRVETVVSLVDATDEHEERKWRTMYLRSESLALPNGKMVDDWCAVQVFIPDSRS
jgi:hypothetical protein